MKKPKVKLDEILRQYSVILRAYQRGVGCSIEDAKALINPAFIDQFGKMFKSLEKRMKRIK